MRRGKSESGPRLRALMCLGGALVALAACTSQDKRIAFDGFYFKAKAKQAEGEDLSTFNVTVFKVSQSLDGARGAAAHEALRYCIDNYGTSRIRWILSPDEPAETLRVVDDTLTFQGECNP